MLSAGCAHADCAALAGVGVRPAALLRGLGAAVALISAAAAAADLADLERCRAITDASLRLACFEAAMEAGAGPPPVAVIVDGTPTTECSRIGDRWAIGVPARDSRFDLRPHRASFLLPARYSDRPNSLPSSPSKPALPAPQAIDETEAKFQISFKVKLADFGDEFGASIWGGYTQQSQWQVYNGAASRPFRETNYEPELMLAFHPDLEVLGWRWRLAMVGLNHQSNGRSEPLSRSWNRLVAQFGFERGRVAVLLRPWWRLPEDPAKDDNPDITRYLGHGDLTLVWTPGAHTVWLGARASVRTGRGALSGAWSFPLARRVKGTLQLFSGYGESLIDYNARQNTIGLGIALADPL